MVPGISSAVCVALVLASVSADVLRESDPGHHDRHGHHGAVRHLRRDRVQDAVDYQDRIVAPARRSPGTDGSRSDEVEVDLWPLEVGIHLPFIWGRAAAAPEAAPKAAPVTQQAKFFANTGPDDHSGEPEQSSTRSWTPRWSRENPVGVRMPRAPSASLPNIGVWTAAFYACCCIYIAFLFLHLLWLYMQFSRVQRDVRKARVESGVPMQYEDRFSDYLQYRFTKWFVWSKNAKGIVLLSLACFFVMFFGVVYYLITGSSLGRACFVIFTQLVEPDGGKTDTTYEGRSVCAVASVGGLIIFAVLIAFTQEQFNAFLEHLRDGAEPVIEAGHFVVIGWTEQSMALILDLCEAYRERGGCKIAVLSELDKPRVEAQIHEAKAKLGNSSVIVRTGKVHSSHALKLVGAHMCRTAIIMSNTAAPLEARDAISLRVLLTLKSSIPFSGRILVHCARVKNLPLFEKLGGANTNVLTVEDFVGRIIVQCSRDVGISTVIKQTIGFGGSEFYIVPAPECIQGHHFAEAMGHFPNAVLAGVLTGGSSRSQERARVARKFASKQASMPMGPAQSEPVVVSGKRAPPALTSLGTFEENEGEEDDDWEVESDTGTRFRWYKDCMETGHIILATDEIVLLADDECDLAPVPCAEIVVDLGDNESDDSDEGFGGNDDDSDPDEEAVVPGRSRTSSAASAIKTMRLSGDSSRKLTLRASKADIMRQNTMANSSPGRRQTPTTTYTSTGRRVTYTPRLGAGRHPGCFASSPQGRKTTTNIPGNSPGELPFSRAQTTGNAPRGQAGEMLLHSPSGSEWSEAPSSRGILKRKSSGIMEVPEVIGAEIVLFLGWNDAVWHMLSELDSCVGRGSKVLSFSEVPVETRRTFLEDQQQYYNRPLKNFVELPGGEALASGMTGGIFMEQGIFGSRFSLEEFLRAHAQPLDKVSRIFVLTDKVCPVMITEDDAEYDPDSGVISTILHLREILNEITKQSAAPPQIDCQEVSTRSRSDSLTAKKRSHINEVPIIAEVRETETEEHCRSAQVLDFIDSVTISAQVLSMVAYEPRLSDMLHELISETGTMSFAIRDLKEYLERDEEPPDQISFFDAMKLGLAQDELVLGWSEQPDEHDDDGRPRASSFGRSIQALTDLNQCTKGISFAEQLQWEMNPKDKTKLREWRAGVGGDRLAVLCQREFECFSHVH